MVVLMQKAEQIEGDQLLVGDPALESVVAEALNIPAQLLLVHFADLAVQGDQFEWVHNTQILYRIRLFFSHSYP